MFNVWPLDLLLLLNSFAAATCLHSTVALANGVNGNRSMVRLYEKENDFPFMCASVGKSPKKMELRFVSFRLSKNYWFFLFWFGFVCQKNLSKYMDNAICTSNISLINKFLVEWNIFNGPKWGRNNLLKSLPWRYMTNAKEHWTRQRWMQPKKERSIYNFIISWPRHVLFQLL